MMLIMQVSGGMIISGDTHGTLKAWNVREHRLHCLKTTNAVEMERKTLVALDFSGNCVITGHVSGSLKSLSWTTGKHQALCTCLVITLYSKVYIHSIFPHLNINK
jgi:hypothetical protein